MLTLFELFGAVFLYIWFGNAVPTPLFLALHPWILPVNLNKKSNGQRRLFFTLS